MLRVHDQIGLDKVPVRPGPGYGDELSYSSARLSSRLCPGSSGARADNSRLQQQNPCEQGLAPAPRAGIESILHHVDLIIRLC